MPGVPQLDVCVLTKHNICWRAGGSGRIVGSQFAYDAPDLSCRFSVLRKILDTGLEQIVQISGLMSPAEYRLHAYSVLPQKRADEVTDPEGGAVSIDPDLRTVIDRDRR